MKENRTEVPGLRAEDDDDDAYGVDLEAIYNRHVGHTHQRALKKVFHAGIQHILAMGRFEIENGKELDELRIQYVNLQKKYDALNAKFNINQPTVDPAHADEMQAKAISQAMGMGNVFQCGNDYQHYE